MDTTHSHEQSHSIPEKGKPKDAQVGFGDLKLREAEAERAVALAQQRLKSPEALAHTREQMVKEQLNKVADSIVKYAEQNGLLQNETSAQFKKRVFQSALITDEVSSLLNEAYTHQDSLNPLAYDNQYQLPYNVVSTDFGFELRPSEALKKEKTKSGNELLWKTQSFNLEEYISELFPQYADEVHEQKKEIDLDELKNKLASSKDDNGKSNISEFAQNMVLELAQKGKITQQTIDNFKGVNGLDGEAELGVMLDHLGKINRPDLKPSDYIHAIETETLKLKPALKKAENRELTIAQDGEDAMRTAIRLDIIEDEAKIPTDAQVEEALEGIKQAEQETANVKSNTEDLLNELKAEMLETGTATTDEEIEDRLSTRVIKKETE